MLLLVILIGYCYASRRNLRKDCNFKGSVTKYPFLDYNLFDDKLSKFIAFEEKIEQLGSYIVEPGDEPTDYRFGYDELVPQHTFLTVGIVPVFIVVVSNEASIVETLAYADQTHTEWRVNSAPRSHEWIVDWVFCEGCIILNLVDFDFITPVSSKDSTFTVEAGVSMAEVIPFLKHYGVITPVPNGQTITYGGMPQGGGFGYYTRQYAAPFNYVKSVRVVAPRKCDYTLVTLDSKHNSDLFWAVRGGSAGPWGIITKWKIQAIVPIKVEAEYFRWFYEWKEEDRDIFPVETILRYYRDIHLNSNNPEFTLHLIVSGGSFTKDVDGNLIPPESRTFSFRWVCLDTPVVCQTYKDDIEDIMDGFNRIRVIEVPNSNIWDATAAVLTPRVFGSRPASPTWFIEPWSNNDIDYLAEQIRNSFDLWAVNNTATWTIWYRGSNENPDVGNQNTAFVFNRFPNLVEVGFGPQLGEDTQQNRDIVNQAAEDMRARFLNRGWYYSYVNGANFQRDYNDPNDPWERDYFGKDINPKIIKRLKRIKGRYDCEGYYDKGFPIQDDNCDEKHSKK